MDFSEIKNHIENLEYLFDEDEKNFWDFIKIKPEIWVDATYGEFWALAIFGKNVLYYNHIEDGYQISSYKEYGKINGTNGSQMDFYRLVQGMYEDKIPGKRL